MYMKKTIKLTESDLIRLVKRVISEQFDGEIKGPQNNFDGEIKSPQNNVDSGYEELKSRLNSYKNEMDEFLDELKSSGTKIDGQRFLKQIQRESNEIFWDIYEKSDKNIHGFGKLQEELLKYFRPKLK